MTYTINWQYKWKEGMYIPIIRIFMYINVYFTCVHISIHNKIQRLIPLIDSISKRKACISIHMYTYVYLYLYMWCIYIWVYIEWITTTVWTNTNFNRLYLHVGWEKENFERKKRSSCGITKRIGGGYCSTRTRRQVWLRIYTLVHM
jgi:hypothetical protein